MISARLELATACVLDRRDNQLHQETILRFDSLYVYVGFGKLPISDKKN